MKTRKQPRQPRTLGADFSHEEFYPGVELLTVELKTLFQLLEEICVPAVVLDNNLTIVAANVAARKIFGQEMVGQKCYRLYHNRNIACEHCHVLETMRDSKPRFHCTEYGSITDYEEKYSCGTAAISTDEQGQVDKVLQVLRRVEKSSLELHQLSLFHRLIDSAGDALFIIDVESGQLVDLNQQSCRLLGCGRSELLGRGWWDILKIDEKRLDCLKRLGNGGEPQHFKTRCFPEDGVSIPVEVSWRDVKNGTHAYRVALVRDISERVKTEADLKAKNEALDGFASAVAHDLRTPLSRVFAFCDFLASDLANKDYENLEKRIDPLRQVAGEMDELVVRLLALARADSRKSDIEELDLTELVHKVVARLKDEIEAKGALISVDELPAVRGNRVLLEQLYQNLLENAIRYGGEKPEIRVGYYQNEDRNVFRVDDRGPGISLKNREAVFQPFWNGEDGGGPGHGIGLTTSRKIVKRHAGKIWVQPSDEGAQFRFTLNL